MTPEETKQLNEYIDTYLKCECTKRMTCRRCLIEVIERLQNLSAINETCKHNTAITIRNAQGLETELQALALQKLIKNVEKSLASQTSQDTKRPRPPVFRNHRPT